MTGIRASRAARSRAARAAALVVALGCAAAGAVAAPRVPRDDGEVLERLALTRNDPVRREEAALREALRRDSRDLPVAVRLARLHMARSRRESDPRQLGQAQAALMPWWDQAQPPVPVLLLRATLRQTAHQFMPALRDLRQVVEREPANAQGWLTLAAVEQVRGSLDEARASCRRLGAIAPPLVTVTCIAGVEGANGHAAPAYTALSAWLARDASQDASTRAWAVTLQAELAERLGRDTEADLSFRSAIALDPSDAYARAAYADFLLDRFRAPEVLRLIDRDTPSDPLLLRYVLAARAAGQSSHASADAERLRERFEASRARGDTVHLREEARFVLAFDGDAGRALRLALDDWAVQKEPADARIVLECANAARRPDAAAEVVAWLGRTHLESARLDALVRALGHPR